MNANRNIIWLNLQIDSADKFCWRKFTMLLFFLFTGISTYGQTAKTHYLGFSTQYYQIKEAANYGLVNQGLNLSVNYDYEKEYESGILTYSPHIAFGPNYRYGLGLNWYFKFIDFFYGFKIGQKTGHSMHIGIYGAVNNFWQLYPELQSGHMFWFTSIEIGPKFQGKYTLGNRELFLKASTSMYGLTSRPIDQTEQYFYSLSIGDVLADSFSNMQFGSNNRFNHTFFEVDYSNPSRNKLTMGYAFEYFNYYDAPTFSYITHSIVLKWALGK
jgi:hypothetical protein